MKFAACLTLFCLCGAVPASRAQTPAGLPDTASYAWGGDTFRLGELVQANGTRLAAYVPSQRMGYEKWIAYFLAPPAPGRMPKRYKANVDELNSVKVHGHYYETMRKPNGRASDVLAYQLLAGPAIELLVYAEPRAIPLPIPLGVGLAMPVVSIKRSDKNHWYLRREGVLTPVVGSGFSQHMSQYLQDDPGLAQNIAANQPGYRYEDIPAIIAEYNRFKGLPITP